MVCISQIEPLQLNQKNEQRIPHFPLSHEKVHRMGELFDGVCYHTYVVVGIHEANL
jgi:hypothetical protein